MDDSGIQLLFLCLAIAVVSLISTGMSSRGARPRPTWHLHLLAIVAAVALVIASKTVRFPPYTYSLTIHLSRITAIGVLGLSCSGILFDRLVRSRKSPSRLRLTGVCLMCASGVFALGWLTWDLSRPAPLPWGMEHPDLHEPVRKTPAYGAVNAWDDAAQ